MRSDPEHHRIQMLSAPMHSLPRGPGAVLDLYAETWDGTDPRIQIEVIVSADRETESPSAAAADVRHRHQARLVRCTSNTSTSGPVPLTLPSQHQMSIIQSCFAAPNPRRPSSRSIGSSSRSMTTEPPLAPHVVSFGSPTTARRIKAVNATARLRARLAHVTADLRRRCVRARRGCVEVFFSHGPAQSRDADDLTSLHELEPVARLPRPL